MSKYLPDQTKVHTYTIAEIEGPTKTFPSKDGTREKYMIKFQEFGYTAEFCPLAGTFSGFHLKAGNKMSFRIVYRKQFGDEIEPFVVDGSQTGDSKSTSKSYNLNGHPASLALRIAADMHISKISNAKSGQKTDIPQTSDMLAEADSLYEWLIGKVSDE